MTCMKNRTWFVRALCLVYLESLDHHLRKQSPGHWVLLILKFLLFAKELSPHHLSFWRSVCITRVDVLPNVVLHCCAPHQASFHRALTAKAGTKRLACIALIRQPVNSEPKSVNTVMVYCIVDCRRSKMSFSWSSVSNISPTALLGKTWHLSLQRSLSQAH